MVDCGMQIQMWDMHCGAGTDLRPNTANEGSLESLVSLQVGGSGCMHINEFFVTGHKH